MPPLVFSPQDPSVLYLGMQLVLKTSDGGRSWHEISPDLTGYVEKERKEGEKAAPGEEASAGHHVSVAFPGVQAGEIWARNDQPAGATHARLRRSRPGRTSLHPGLTAPAEILYVEASHHDAATAYLTVGGTRVSTPPAIFRTHDYGKTWQKIVSGFPPDEMVRVLREDPKRERSALCRNRYQCLRLLG